MKDERNRIVWIIDLDRFFLSPPPNVRKKYVDHLCGIPTSTVRFGRYRASENGDIDRFETGTTYTFTGGLFSSATVTMSEHLDVEEMKFWKETRKLFPYLSMIGTTFPTIENPLDFHRVCPVD